MPNYRAYPTAKSVPKRKHRKAMRKAIYWENAFKSSAERKARRLLCQNM